MVAMDDEWIEVASGEPVAAADEAFRQWLADSGVDRGSLAGDDLRVDTGRTTSGGDFRRYRIRRTALPK
jgi:hypothetical protein